MQIDEVKLVMQEEFSIRHGTELFGDSGAMSFLLAQTRQALER